MATIINEEITDEEEHDCCPQCGSLGIFHFDDKKGGTTFRVSHKCLRCDARWAECFESDAVTGLARHRIDVKPKLVSWRWMEDREE